MRTGTARFVRLIPTIKLIYGKKLDLKELYKKTNSELFKANIRVFQNLFFPLYAENKIEFQALLKQTLWLFELEASVTNNNFIFSSWNDLAKQFTKEHLIHAAIKLKNSDDINIDIENIFIQDLKLYVKTMSEKYN